MKKLFLILLLGFLFLYIVPLGIRSMAIPDETRYAEIPREILNTGDWVVPRLNGLRYFEKPVLGYWANALSIKLFGENAFAIRLPSALAAGLTAFFIFCFVRKFGEGRTTGLLAAGVFLTCAEVFAVGTFCILDGLFSLFVAAAIISFYFAYRGESPRERTIYLALTGIACGLAFLVKGFIAFAVPVMAIVPFLLWDRKINTLWKSFWIPILTSILIALPWSIMIYLRENDFWKYFFWQEHVKRFFSSNAQHSAPIWFFVPVIIAGALPWTANLPDIIKGLKKIQLKDSFIRYLLCWLIFPFLFFSVSSGKLATYILPCFPPLAILITLGLVKHFSVSQDKKTTLPGSALLLIIGVCALIAMHTILPRFAIYDLKEIWKLVFLSIALLWYAVFLVIDSRNTNSTTKIILRCFAPMCLMFSLPFIVPNSFQSGKMLENLLINNAKQIRPDTIIISDSYLSPMICWFYHRTDIYLVGEGGELAYGLGYGDSKYKRVPTEELADFIKRTSKGCKVVLIIKKKDYDIYRKVVPKAINEMVDGAFIIAEFVSPGR